MIHIKPLRNSYRWMLLPVAALAGALLFQAAPAKATYWRANVRDGSDIVMKDHRWPLEDRGTYYAFWLMSFVPEHPRLGSMYGGMHPGGPNSSPGVFMSYWGEVRNVYEGELFYPHGYGAEGASGGAHGEAHFLRPNAWYRNVKRIFASERDGQQRTWVGWWIKDVAKDRWYTHSIVELPVEATGFKVGSSGFVEALGPPTVHRAFERRLGYCRKDGQWHKADTVSSHGWKFFKLIEDGTVLRYDRAEKDDPSVQTRKEFVTRQPDNPPLDPPGVAEASALGFGNQVAVSWQIPLGASPQLGYQLEVFDRPGADGEPMAVFAESVPYVRAKRLDTPRPPRSVRLTITDIFDQTTARIVPVASQQPWPAAQADRTRPGLAYVYFEAPSGADWTRLPDFSALMPVRQGHVAALDDSIRGQRERLYAQRYTGYLRAPADGLYVLTVRTCDGSRLRLDGQAVAEHDGLHGRSARQYPLALQAGLHPFEMEYFYGAGRGHHGNLPDLLAVSWEGPGIAARRLGRDDFRCTTVADLPQVTLALGGETTGDGVVEDNLVSIHATLNRCGHQPERLQIYAGQRLLETIEGDALAGREEVSVEELFPAGENRIWARLWYDDDHSIDAENVLEFATQDYNDGPWQFVRLGHEFPLGARYKGGTASFSGEGSCVAWQKVDGDFTLTAHIKDITLRGRDSDVYDQNWLGLYTSDVGRLNPAVGLKSTFHDHGFGIYLTAGRGMKGWADFDDLGGSRMSIAAFPSDHRWLRVVRRGKRLQSFTSADGRNWRKAQEIIPRSQTPERYVGLWFRAVPGKGRRVFQGAIDQVTLEEGIVPVEPLPRVPPEDLRWKQRIAAVVQAAGDPNVLFARGPEMGLLRSDDRGETWQPVNEGLDQELAAMPVRSVAVHPTNSSIVLRGGGRVVDGTLQSGLWRSTDGGRSWTLVTRRIDFDGRGPTVFFGEVIAFCPQDPGMAVAAGETSGLFISRDAGQTWQPAGLAGERVTCLGFNADTPRQSAQLVVGSSDDPGLAALGLGQPATAVDAPARVYWGRLADGRCQLSPCLELDRLAVTNVTFGAYHTFATVATSRGLYYTWQGGGTFSQRRDDVPADRLITALGYRQYPKQVGPGDVRTKSDTYAAAFSAPQDDPSSGHAAAATQNPVHWVPERTALLWRAWSPEAPILDVGSGARLSDGISCLLPDRADPSTLYLCNRHGVFKTTDGGRSYRRVHPAAPIK